jgi:hypothetical protein
MKWRVLSLYDGRALIGHIKIANEGEARAFNQRGKLLGRFASLKSALDSFNQRRLVGAPAVKGAGGSGKS